MCMEMCRDVWRFVGEYGDVYVCMEMCRCVWRCVGVYGDV